MKTVTYNEAIALLTQIGHLANITVPVAVRDYNGNEVGTEQKTVLNESFVYNPYEGYQVGSLPTAGENAEKAMKFIKKNFTVRSGYYGWANGDYEIK